MRKVFGAILLAIGILIAGGSGLCSLYFLSIMGSSDSEFFAIVAMVGGIPFALGIGLAFLGWRLLRSANQSGQSPQDQSNTFR